MQAHAYARSGPIEALSESPVWNTGLTRSVFGDLALVLFLLAQCFDGVLTYVGVVSIGIHIEANPLVTALMLELGHGAGLATAKLVAGALGIYLHVYQVHLAVALLTVFYVAVAIVPWTALLFF